MSGLWVGDTHSVKKDSDLFASSAPQAYVCLYTFGPPLAYIHTHCKLQQVIYVGCRNGRNGQAVQYCDHPGALAKECGKTACGDDNTLELFIDFLRLAGPSG
jgi:hypothetical protein